MFMKRAGFSVAEAATVREAMDLLAPPPDWMLLDLMLPDGSGLCLIEHVRRSALPTKVCVVSGCHQTLIDQAVQAGAHSAFVKPLDVRQVIASMVS